MPMPSIVHIPWQKVVEYTEKYCNVQVRQIIADCQCIGKMKLSQIRTLLSSDTGFKTFELCGHIRLGKTAGNLDFHVDTSAVGHDVQLDRPVSMLTLHGLDPVWHLHPVNSMPLLDLDTHSYMSNFFSLQDVDWCITNPMAISVICNKVSEIRAFRFPCIYVFMYVPHLLPSVESTTGPSVPTAELHDTFTAYQRRVVPHVIEKIHNFTKTKTDCEIDWPTIVEEFRRRCIILHCLYSYDEMKLYQTIRGLQQDYR